MSERRDYEVTVTLAVGAYNWKEAAEAATRAGLVVGAMIGETCVVAVALERYPEER